ncbi:hypothetical protein GE061_006899 [Apolygus lucorum]|uniref:CBS domain-containing protein n=1 Tax=Apolygus lucorum TaxID=248454 RepID=A0A8S9WSS4_APOLU|nr:hypothetical protein GE061_006899 [Apolygus lucorum]
MTGLFCFQAWAEPAKYAVIGAAAHLGGICRISISLTVMMIEATGNITFGLPLMLTLITTKWIGDFFTEGIYEMQIYLNGVPLLPSAPPPLSSDIKATDVMSAPPVVFTSKVKVARIIDTLDSVPHNGFPIVEPVPPSASGHVSNQGVLKSAGRLKGLILKSQLLILLHSKSFNELVPHTSEQLRKKLHMFREAYAKHQKIQVCQLRSGWIEDVQITEEDCNQVLDLRPYMNPSPYTVKLDASLPRIFRLFRGLGLRHIVVVNEVNEVVGMNYGCKYDKRRMLWSEKGRPGWKNSSKKPSKRPIQHSEDIQKNSVMSSPWYERDLWTKPLSVPFVHRRSPEPSNSSLRFSILLRIFQL